MAQPGGDSTSANTSDYFVRKNERQILDADMTPRDVIGALKRLRFQDGSSAICAIRSPLRRWRGAPSSQQLKSGGLPSGAIKPQ